MLFYFVITLLFQNCLSDVKKTTKYDPSWALTWDWGTPFIDLGRDYKLPPWLVRPTISREQADYNSFLGFGPPLDIIRGVEQYLVRTGQKPEGYRFSVYQGKGMEKNMLMMPTPVKPEEYAFLVTVYGGKLFCGGAVIGPSWVLTAAHCIHSKVLDQSGKVKVRAGFTSPKELVQERTSSKLIIHKKYDANDFNSGYDIGLIQVDPRFKVTKALSVIPIAGPGIAKKCRFGRVCGIGNGFLLSRNGGTMSYETAIKRPLKCTDMFMDNTTKCITASKATASVKSKLLFARVWGNACQGDSGGPLICKNVVIGVVTKQGPCGGKTLSCQAYTKVEDFGDFLEENIDGFVVPKNEGSIKNQTKADKKSKAGGVIHSGFWQLWVIPLFTVFVFR